MVTSLHNPSKVFEFTIIVNNEKETIEFAQTLATVLKIDDIVTLSGDLGAGKTSFARALIRSITKNPLLEVLSPSFTLMQNYDGPDFPMVHADLYRLQDPEELIELGFEDAINGTLSIIEWPERAPQFFKSNYLNINIEMLPVLHRDSRKLILTGTDVFSARIAHLFSIARLLKSSGWDNAHRTIIAGDASARHFERLTQDGHNSILMSSQRPSQGLIVEAQQRYRKTAKLSASLGSFVAVADGLRSSGFSAPEIFIADIEAGLALVEDFGTEGIADSDGPNLDRYREATILLAQLHTLELPRALPLRGKSQYRLPAYDIDALLVEVELFLDWYIPANQQKKITQLERDKFLNIWHRILEPCMVEKNTWTLRDYHSPNLFWLKEREGIKRIGLIDIQDTLWGPPAYDLCSLLQDARVSISEQFELELFEFYIQFRQEQDLDFDMASFVASYAIYGAQRATKVLGIFVRLAQRDGKPNYLRYLPQIQAYLRRNLRHPALSEYQEWLSQFSHEILIHPPGS
jgi:tRNA threonylcarbamoyl adenosine modification protein YjeE